MAQVRLIMDNLGVDLMDPEDARRYMIGQNPLNWLIEVDGFVVDAKSPPEVLQVEARNKSLIPYVPGTCD